MTPELQSSSTAAPAAATALYRKLAALGQDAYDLAACERYAAQIDEINRLKAGRGAVVLAHNYQRPEIFEVADFIGDSLELAYKAREVRDAGIIVFCGVHFMAESVTAEALAERKAELREIYPDLKVVSYVNCTADVKAESDACCTSANALKVVEAIDSRHVLFVPDKNLANYVQSQTSKKIISWDGNCYVHHQITAEEVDRVKRAIPGIKVLAHPECRTDVLRLADAGLSTSAVVRYAETSEADKFLVVTECGLSDRLLMEIPNKHFYKACKLCRFMKMITLEGTLDSLRHLRYEIELTEDVREGARRALERMPELAA